MSSIFANQQEITNSDPLFGENQFMRGDSSPKKVGSGLTSEVQEPQFAGAFDFSSGNLFSKPAFNSIPEGTLF